jgi:hypothetical protein
MRLILLFLFPVDINVPSLHLLQIELEHGLSALSEMDENYS